MFNLSKKEYLLSIGKPFQKMGFKVIIKDKQIINDSYVALTITNQKDYLQINIKTNWIRFLSSNSLSILCSNFDFLTDLERINRNAEIETGYYNSKKKKFHKELDELLIELRNPREINITQTQLRESISKIQSNQIYQEQLSIYDFNNPAVGITKDNEEFEFIYGIAVGGDKAGGLLLFNPTINQLNPESYIGFGIYGKYNSYVHHKNNTSIIEHPTVSLGKFSRDIPDTE